MPNQEASTIARICGALTALLTLTLLLSLAISAQQTAATCAR